MLRVGNTLLIRTPPDYTTEHLFIIIAIQEKVQKALIVNITKQKTGSDSSCTISAGEHPFVKSNSVINYAEAKITDISNLEESLKKELIKPHASVSTELLKKIREGALTSPAIPYKCLEFISSAN